MENGTIYRTFRPGVAPTLLLSPLISRPSPCPPTTENLGEPQCLKLLLLDRYSRRFVTEPALPVCIYIISIPAERPAWRASPELKRAPAVSNLRAKPFPIIPGANRRS